MDRQLKLIILELDKMIKRKETEVRLLKTNQSPNQTAIEITQSELNGMINAWNVIMKHTRGK